MMDTTRFLIVNADDFGQSRGINRGIIAAHENGIVTSASLMVRCPAAVEAAAYARAHPALGLGLHVDLGEWIYRNGEWVARYEVVSTVNADQIAKEIASQIAVFYWLTGRRPTHLDSHQNVHLREPARRCFIEAAARCALPLRQHTPGLHYRGDFYGQTAEGLPLPEAIEADRLIRIIRTLPPGLTELTCHPGEADDIETTYRHERALELRTLCNPRVRDALTAAGVALCSFDNALMRVGAESSAPW